MDYLSNVACKLIHFITKSSGGLQMKRCIGIPSWIFQFKILVIRSCTIIVVCLDFSFKCQGWYVNGERVKVIHFNVCILEEV